MTYALRIFFIIWYNYKQITIPPPGFGLLDTSGKRHLGDTIFGGTDMRISRQNKILELIETYEIETQDKLASLLREFGYEVTQATISRDIKELHLIKILSSTGKYKYAVAATNDTPISGRLSNFPGNRQIYGLFRKHRAAENPFGLCKRRSRSTGFLRDPPRDRLSCRR